MILKIGNIPAGDLHIRFPTCLGGLTVLGVFHLYDAGTSNPLVCWPIVDENIASTRAAEIPGDSTGRIVRRDISHRGITGSTFEANEPCAYCACSLSADVAVADNGFIDGLGDWKENGCGCVGGLLLGRKQCGGFANGAAEALEVRCLEWHVGGNRNRFQNEIKVVKMPNTAPWRDLIYFICIMVRQTPMSRRRHQGGEEVGIPRQQ